MSVAAKPLFTVFTPTYNRAPLLPRLYEALRQQTLQDFEWLIVDDGSADGTPELVAGWQATSPFPIRYFWQENRGKPSAHNKGVAEARGELFIVQDSDDWPLPHALARFVALWEEIPTADRERYTGVSVNTSYPDGVVIGARFPAPRMDGNIAGLVASGAMVGDKWGFHRLAVLQQFPFPLFDGERYIPEGVVWNRIGRKYQMRFVDEVLQVKEYQVGGITHGIGRTLVRYPRGAWLFYRESLLDDVSLRRRLRVAASVFRYAFHGGGSVAESWSAAGGFAVAGIGIVIGGLAWASDMGSKLMAKRSS